MKHSKFTINTYINTSNYTKHTALMKILLAVFVCYFLLCVNTTKKATHTKTYKIQKVPLWLITLRLVICFLSFSVPQSVVVFVSPTMCNF